MFKQLMSRIKEDDNPRLHRTPFFLIWIASYGLGWFLLRTYETVWCHSQLCQHTIWLKGGRSFNSNMWREDLLLGVLFGLVISLIQPWLLRRRYGYVPKFWRIATFIGAIVAGFGYTRVGMADFPSYFPASKLTFVVDFLIWFTVLNLFQAIVMFRVNRRAWQIAGVGLAAGLSASAIYYFGLAGFVDSTIGLTTYLVSAKIGLLVGIVIQVIGTGLVMMRLMAEPREGIIPKRDDTEKPKNRVPDGLHPVTFVALWTGAYFMARLILILTWELYEIGLRWGISDFNDFNFWWYHEIRLGWINYGLFFIIVGLVWGIAKKWLMQKYHNIRVRHWILFSTMGWCIAGICIAQRLYLYPRQGDAWLVAHFIIPGLFQTLLMMRTMRRGWFWLAGGFVAAIVAILITPDSSSYWRWQFPGILIGGLVLSLSTALIFLFLQPKSANQPEKMKRVEEVV